MRVRMIGAEMRVVHHMRCSIAMVDCSRHSSLEPGLASGLSSMTEVPVVDERGKGNGVVLMVQI